MRCYEVMMSAVMESFFPVLSRVSTLQAVPTPLSLSQASPPRNVFSPFSRQSLLFLFLTSTFNFGTTHFASLMFSDVFIFVHREKDINQVISNLRVPEN